MSNRSGYIIVKKAHRLLPEAAVRNIQKRIGQIIDTINSIQKLYQSNIPYSIRSLMHSNQQPSVFLKTIFNTSESQNVRVLFSDENLPENSIVSIFETNLLLVTLSSGTLYGQVLGTPGRKNGCHIKVPEEKIERIIEDIFIDISVGHALRAIEQYSDVLTNYGYSYFYALKGDFFRARLSRSWIGSAAKDIGYAPISSLNNCSDSDITGRAEAALQAWHEFGTSLTIEAARTTSRSPSATQSISLKAQRQRFLKVNKQLPLKRVASAARTLPDGSYMLLVLRRSSRARKSPKIRGQIAAIFGKHARINSFKFIAKNTFTQHTETIRELNKSSHVILISTQVLDGNIIMDTE